MSEYPRLAVDRDVIALRDGQPEQTRMRAELENGVLSCTLMYNCGRGDDDRVRGKGGPA
jgi:hypothetical protein